MNSRDDLLGPVRFIEVLKARSRQLQNARPSFVVEVKRAANVRVTVEAKIESCNDGSTIARIVIAAA